VGIEGEGKRWERGREGKGREVRKAGEGGREAREGVHLTLCRSLALHVSPASLA